MLLATLLFSSPAFAVPSFRWTPAEPVHYYLDTLISFGESTSAWARKNHEARLSEVKMVAETTCVPRALGKSTELTCTFSYLDFGLTAIGSSTQAIADIIAKDWEDYAKTAKVEIVIAPDGSVKEFDLDGLERHTLEEGRLIEVFRGYFMRLFSPLDLPLSTSDKDWIRGWEQKKLGMMLQLPTGTGTAGAGTLKHTAGAERFGLVQVFSEGRGTVALGGAVDESANGGLVDLRAAGEAWVDPAAGQLLFRGYSTDGQRLASSSGGTYQGFINQRSALQRVASFSPEHTPPNSVLSDRAPRIDVAPPAPPEGVVLVEFSALAMQPLFIQGMPQVAEGYELPTSNVGARVVVGTDGKAESVAVVKGYEMLVEHVERGLKAATFPVAPGKYAVDVVVEVRP